jgi:hypothetical protein
MCRLLALPFPEAFLQWPLTVLTRETRQAVHAINQSMVGPNLLICKKRKEGLGDPQNYEHIVMSQLHETIIP